MKYNDFEEQMKLHIDFMCMMCLEKRNLTKIGKSKSSPCALRSIRGEICDEIEKVLHLVKEGEKGLYFDDIRLKTK